MRRTVYLPTWMVDFYGFHVGIYTSPMDPMGIGVYCTTIVFGRAGLLNCEFQDFHQGQKVRRFTMQKKSTANFLHDSPCPSFIQLRYHPGRRNHGKPAVVSVSESRLLRRVFNTLIYAYMFHNRLWCQNFEIFTLLIPTWQNDLIWLIFSDELKPSTTYTYQLVSLTVVHHFAYFCWVYISHGHWTLMIVSVYFLAIKQRSKIIISIPRKI